jgi:hypothetical protein
MFPFIFEWNWDAGHVIFMGGLWYALVIIGCGLTWVVAKSVKDTLSGKEDDNHGQEPFNAHD